MKTILCYGDSNTYGLIGGTKERFPRDIRWSGRLQQLLGHEYHIIEEGLNGRTTVWDDPIEEHKNGKAYLLPCLESHKPIDIVIMMLGTNDLKLRFSVSVFDISEAIDNLVQTILTSGAGHTGLPPAMLLVCPAPIRDVGNANFNQMLEGGFEKSRRLHSYYKQIAEQRDVYYMDAGEGIELSSVDGVHFTENGHKTFAAMAESKLREIVTNGLQKRWVR